jgi:hypothetical protein
MAGITFLFNTLSGDSALMALVPNGIFRGMAPDQTVPPFIVLSFMAGPDTNTANAVRMMTRPLYQVTVQGPAGMSTILAAAAARIDDLLKRASGSVAGARIDAFYREQPLLRDLPPSLGVMWSAIGGLYRGEIEQV